MHQHGLREEPTQAEQLRLSVSWAHLYQPIEDGQSACYQYVEAVVVLFPPIFQRQQTIACLKDEL